MDEVIQDILDELGAGFVDYAKFQRLLAECDLMIVPIEDPTNLRYGVEDE